MAPEPMIPIVVLGVVTLLAAAAIFGIMFVLSPRRFPRLTRECFSSRPDYRVLITGDAVDVALRLQDATTFLEQDSLDRLGDAAVQAGLTSGEAARTANQRGRLELVVGDVLTLASTLPRPRRCVAALPGAESVFLMLAAPPTDRSLASAFNDKRTVFACSNAGAAQVLRAMLRACQLDPDRARIRIDGDSLLLGLASSGHPDGAMVSCLLASSAHPRLRHLPVSSVVFPDPAAIDRARLSALLPFVRIDDVDIASFVGPAYMGPNRVVLTAMPDTVVVLALASSETPYRDTAARILSAVSSLPGYAPRYDALRCNACAAVMGDDQDASRLIKQNV